MYLTTFMSRAFLAITDLIAEKKQQLNHGLTGEKSISMLKYIWRLLICQCYTLNTVSM